MKYTYIKMYQLVTQDNYIASDWFYSRAECHNHNATMFNSFIIESDIVEHIIVDNVAYPTCTIANQIMRLESIGDNEFVVTY